MPHLLAANPEAVLLQADLVVVVLALSLLLVLALQAVEDLLDDDGLLGLLEAALLDLGKDHLLLGLIDVVVVDDQGGGLFADDDVLLLEGLPDDLRLQDLLDALSAAAGRRRRLRLGLGLPHVVQAVVVLLLLLDPVVDVPRLGDERDWQGGDHLLVEPSEIHQLGVSALPEGQMAGQGVPLVYPEGGGRRHGDEAKEDGQCHLKVEKGRHAGGRAGCTGCVSKNLTLRTLTVKKHVKTGLKLINNSF